MNLKKKTSLTWLRHKPKLIASQLDIFLVLMDMLGNVSKANIIPGFRSDHSVVALSINVTEKPKRISYHKVNSSKLNDKENIRELCSTIQDAICQGDSFDAISLWEFVKVMIRSKCIEISCEKAKHITNLDAVKED